MFLHHPWPLPPQPSLCHPCDERPSGRQSEVVAMGSAEMPASPPPFPLPLGMGRKWGSDCIVCLGCKLPEAGLGLPLTSLNW